MKTLRLLILLAALLFAGVLAPARTRADDTVSFDFFYDSLAPYGEWIEVGDYGMCWRPRGVDSDWTPYSDGYWAYTDGGWTWVSYEDFGGIVYHYGRWLHLDDDTWCWTPGYEWAPAWVSWRSNDDYVGWAPLPPEARWQQDTGISIWVDNVCDIGPGYYHFCRVRDFGAPYLRGVLCRPSENIVIIRTTVNITNITYNTTFIGGPVIFIGGPSFEFINRRCARPIPALKLVRNGDFDAAHWRDHRGPDGKLAFHSKMVGNQLIVPAPKVLKPADLSEFKGRVKKQLPGDSVTKGWDLVKNPDVQKEMRAEMKRQTKGLTPQTAPARKLVSSDLQSVPTTADPNAVISTNEKHEKNGKSKRSEGVAEQPGNAPVATETPTDRSNGAFREKNRMKDLPPNTAPATGGVLKPFNPNADTGNVPDKGRGHSIDASQQERAAEAAKMRSDEERDAQRRAEFEKQQQKEAAKQQQREAAQSQAEDMRRREIIDQQRQFDEKRQQQFQKQQQQQQQPQPQQQQQMQRNNDARRAQEADRERQKFESERNSQIQQRPPQPQQQNNNPGGGHSSKDSKDKDKDKDKKGN